MAAAGVACGGQRGATVTSGAVGDDQAAAQRALIRLTDLPGYDALPTVSAAPQAVQGATSFESCAGAAIVLGEPDRTALSPAFHKGTTHAVSSLAIVAADEDGARAAMAGLAQAGVAQCLTGLFRTVLDLDLLPGTTASTAPLAAPRIEDESVTWRTTMQIALSGQTIPAYADLTFFRSGRTVASLLNFQLGEPFPAAERAKLLNAMAARA